MRTGDLALQTARETLWRQPNTRLLPITAAILRDAAQLRANIPGLKTPDAIHAATALSYGCAAFVTNDAGFRRIHRTRACETCPSSSSTTCSPDNLGPTLQPLRRRLTLARYFRYHSAITRRRSRRPLHTGDTIHGAKRRRYPTIGTQTLDSKTH